MEKKWAVLKHFLEDTDEEAEGEHPLELDEPRDRGPQLSTDDHHNHQHTRRGLQ